MCKLFETVVLHAYILTHRLDNLFFLLKLYKLNRIYQITTHHALRTKNKKLYLYLAGICPKFDPETHFRRHRIEPQCLWDRTLLLDPHKQNIPASLSPGLFNQRCSGWRSGFMALTAPLQPISGRIFKTIRKFFNFLITIENLCTYIQYCKMTIIN